MAADPNPDWLSGLPSCWSYGVIRDGRVFFINEEAKSTSWLHPVTGEAVITGHRKTADLPSGWEEGFTFEGAKCFINHNERKVTCKHPVSGAPSQDNCIFVVNEQPPSKPAATEKKERPTSTMSEASNYTGASDYSIQQNSPTARPSRSLKKVHNFGKRSNSIKRNPNAPVVKRSWLYKQDSAGMKMWKKRWFVLCDMCLFYYKDEKEEGILGSILLPSFHISMLSVDDHISKKYAFKAAHPNMRTYYFCTDTAKEMESWMKVMTDAALVHTEPIRRLEKTKVETQTPVEINNMNHWVLTQPEIRNNERNRENLHHPEEKKQKQLNIQSRIHREKEFSRKLTVEKDGRIDAPQMVEEKNLPPDPVENLLLQVDSEMFTRQKKSKSQTRKTEMDGEKYFLQQDLKFSLQKHEEKEHQQKDGTRLRRQDSAQKETERPRLQREGEGSDFRKDLEQQLSKISSVKPAQVRSTSTSASVASSSAPHKASELNGSAGDRSSEEILNTLPQRTSGEHPEPAELHKGLSRTSSMQQLEQWMRTYHTRAQEEDSRSITSYRTLPRNMPSHRTQVVPKYPEGYRTLPRNMLRPDSICSVASSTYDSALQPTTAAKRRSVRDDTLWQLYEWQQRQAYSRMGYGTLPGHGAMSHIAESIPSSPSHGSLTTYRFASQSRPFNPSTTSELSSPVFHGDVSSDRHHRAHLTKYAYPSECRTPAAQNITQQSLQDKTMKVEKHRENFLEHRAEDLDVDTKLSRLCEQGKVVRSQEEKLQQLHREKHTLETALLSASQEIEMSAENPAAVQNLIQQRDVLQSGLLSTCRELQRVNTELNRSWKEYDNLETDVCLAKQNLLEQLEALGSPQTEPPSKQHVQIQKELWRIQDVMDALNKNKPKRSTEPDDSVSGLQKEGPDYRLYKSEPELTTVTEVDESNGEEKLEPAADKEPSVIKEFSPVRIVSSRNKSPVPVPSSIASYVTLRKTKKPESKLDRPHSVVEQVYGGIDGARQRMSVEEQMERIRRHQEGALRERRKEDCSLSRSLSFTRDPQHYYTLQMGRRRRETTGGEPDYRKTPALLKENCHVHEDQNKTLSLNKLGEKMSETTQSQEQQRPRELSDHRRITEDCLQTAVMIRVGTEEKEEEDEEMEDEGQEKISQDPYHLLSSKISTMVSVNLSSLSQSSNPPPQHPPSPPKLPDGSHFMCV